LLAAASVALGARSFQDGVEDRETLVWPKEMKNRGDRGYEYTFEAVTDLYWDEGDYEGEDVIDEPYRYWGALRISVNPNQRIEISYVPDREAAAAYHMSEAVRQTGDKLTVYQPIELSLRLDLDSTAPEGMAVDFGRGDFEGEKFLREGDLLGRVLGSVRPGSSTHFYEGFSPGMVEQFRPAAEELIMQMALQFQEKLNRFPDGELLDQIEVRMRERRARGDFTANEFGGFARTQAQQAGTTVTTASDIGSVTRSCKPRRSPMSPAPTASSGRGLSPRSEIKCVHFSG
jgi:hypothetical protein